MRKSIISLGLLLTMSASVSCALAHSTIYTDDIGRMHFLGKDSGGQSLQQVSDFNNPAQINIKNGDITKGIYNSDVINTPPNAGYPERKYKAVSNVQHESKSTGSFTYNKGAMDASNPYTYGETNINTPEKTVKKKHFWNR